MTVDVVCTVYNGERYLPDFLQSLTAQTHGDWRLWIRDDGSTDTTVDLLRARAASDPRIRVVESGGARLGSTASFGWLLEQLPAGTEYVMFADHDDVWLPGKIEVTMDAMRAAETRHAGAAILVHTDLSVVDAQLRMLHPSLWDIGLVAPEHGATLRRIIVHNVVNGATMMMNQRLRDLIGSTPREAVQHDWWYAAVAAAFGHIVAVRRATMLYRQHGANVTGATGGPKSLATLPADIVGALRNREWYRRVLAQSASQARAFLLRYGEKVTPEDRRFLEAYAQLPELGFARRRIDLLRLRALPEHGLLRKLSIVLRG